MDEIIKLPYGTTLNKVFQFNIESDPGDRVLFVIRNNNDVAIFDETIEPEYNKASGITTVVVNVPYDKMLDVPVGSYKYGLALYHEATITDGKLTAGNVETLVAKGQLTITENIARTEGVDLSDNTVGTPDNGGTTDEPSVDDPTNDPGDESFVAVDDPSYVQESNFSIDKESFAEHTHGTYNKNLSSLAYWSNTEAILESAVNYIKQALSSCNDFDVRTTVCVGIVGETAGDGFDSMGNTDTSAALVHNTSAYSVSSLDVTSELSGATFYVTPSYSVSVVSLRYALDFGDTAVADFVCNGVNADITGMDLNSISSTATIGLTNTGSGAVIISITAPFGSV